MTFKDVFKNTVFPLIIGVVLVLISCGNVKKTEEKKNIEIPGFTQNDSSLVVGANRTELYLPILEGKQVGIVANQTSVIFKSTPKTLESRNLGVLSSRTSDNNYMHIVDSLLSLNINITKVFSPEHGFRGKADAGELVEDGVDTKTKLPIVSLHGKNKKPTKAQLEGLDILVFDIQDVGVRFYTYISTLHHVMEACAEQNIPVLILDRPNPNGHYVDGPTLKSEHSSFLGMHPIPLVHGMTIGEYAKMINGEKWLAGDLQCDITVIPVKHYTHDTFYSLPIRPSPNLPNDQAIKLYPSLGLFEGTTINAGRGTEFQFQRYGAPYLDKTALSFEYTPVPNFGAKHPKHKNTLCYGEDLRDATVEGMTLKWVISAYNNATDKSLMFNTKNFTTHAGTELLQQQIEQGLTEAVIKATWQEDLEAYKKIRAKYLIYD